MPDGGALLFRDGWRAGWKPDPILTVSEWADQNRMLSSKASSEPGIWRTSRVPYSREIMDCLSDHHPAHEVVFMASTQVGKTEIGLNWLGYTIDMTPAPMLAVLPTVDVGGRWSKQRLAPMIADSPRLSAKVAPARSRDSGNTTGMKEFDGGILINTGANSAAGLSSMPMKKILFDEIDRYPVEIEDEGDPMDIAEARTTTFPRYKMFKCSSPTIESLSRINKAWKRSDQRRYFVPCPDCGEKQYLKWDQLQYDQEHPGSARYACEHCGVLIDEHHKTRMLAAGEWRPTFPEREVVGFHINALYTPLGLGKRWGEHARRFEEVKRDPVRLKVFTNTVLGECYEDPNEKLDWEELKARAEPYALRTVPVGCLKITAGVDVQGAHGGRIEVGVVGWGRGERCWVLDHYVIPGDPTRPEVWNALEEYLAQPLRNQFGVDMHISTTFVDSGYLTDDVLNFTRARKGKRIFAVKGGSVRGRQIISRPNKVDVNWRGTVMKKSAELWTLGVDTAKHRFFARLAGDRKATLASDRMINFSDQLSDDYFMQLCAEVYDPNKRAWIKLHGRHNEALDIMIYAMAAAMHPSVRVHTIRAPQWEELEKMLQPGNPVVTAAGGEKKIIKGVASEAKPQIARPTKHGSNWVTGFRS